MSLAFVSCPVLAHRPGTGAELYRTREAVRRLYEEVHRWMDEGQAVHAAWQLRDVWEGLLKFLASLAVAD